MGRIREMAEQGWSGAVEPYTLWTPTGATEETNVASIRMHTALGFTPSGHIDNLPQGVRELLFYKRIPPRGA